MLKELSYGNNFCYNIGTFFKNSIKLRSWAIIGIVGIILFPCAALSEWDIDIYDSPSYNDKSVIVITKENGEKCKLLIKTNDISKKRKEIYRWFDGLSETNCRNKNSRSGHERLRMDKVRGVIEVY